MPERRLRDNDGLRCSDDWLVKRFDAPYRTAEASPMTEIEFAIVVLLAVAGGWLIGIVGFFHAIMARREIAQLRRAVADMRGRRAAVTGVRSPETPPWRASERPVAPAPPRSAEPAAPSRDLEAVLTTRWGVWLGAAALVLAGVFLVRYAVDQGLLGPGPRCVFAGLLGAALIVGAEWLRRQEVAHPGIADQTAPGLAAGGVAVLFGASYGAGVLYALVSPAGRVRADGGRLADRPWYRAAPRATGRRGRTGRRLRHAGPGADRESLVAGPVRISAVRHRHGARAWCAMRPGSGSAGRPRSPERSGCWSESRTGQAARHGLRRCSHQPPRCSI